MVFDSVEALTPCLTSRLSAQTRSVWKERYRMGKKYGIRATFSGVTCIGLVTVAKEVAADGIKRHGKRYLGSILMTSSLTGLSFAVPLLSNATKVVKFSKSCHSVCAAAWRASHNLVELPFIFCDYAIFGEYVPSCGESDYDLFSDTTDFISSFLD